MKKRTFAAAAACAAIGMGTTSVRSMVLKPQTWQEQLQFGGISAIVLASLHDMVALVERRDSEVVPLELVDTDPAVIFYRGQIEEVLWTRESTMGYGARPAVGPMLYMLATRTGGRGYVDERYLPFLGDRALLLLGHIVPRLSAKLRNRVPIYGGGGAHSDFPLPTGLVETVDRLASETGFVRSK